MINYILGLFSKDIGIDLGTANTLIYVKGEGVVLCEPSVVAIEKSTKKILKVGEEAKMMIGRTPGDIMAIRPMMNGVISDFEITEKMIREFISKAYRRTLIGPRIVIGVPSGITEVEKKAVRDAAEMAGARHGEVYLIEEPMAAAIGANMPITEPAGNMIVDIGGGTTEVAIISLGGIVLSNSIRIGGDELDHALVNYIKKAYNLLIGDRTAEEIKIKIGSAFPLSKDESVEIKGRDVVTGLPKTLKITSEEVREAMSEPISSIVHLVITSLEKTPPELASDIVDRGVVLAGGGSLLRGLDKLLLKETGLPIIIADDPLRCVVLGTGKCLEEIKFLKRIKK